MPINDDDPIATAIAELEVKKDEIDRALHALRSILAERQIVVGVTGPWLRNMSLRQAITAVLAIRPGPKTSAEIHATLQDGGFQFVSADHRLSVNQALHRMGKERLIFKAGYGQWSIK